MRLISAIKNYFKDIFSYKELIYNLTLKDLKVRYKTAALGFLWALLNPLIMMIIFSIVFSLFMKIQIEKYPIFLLTALLPWHFLSQSLSISTTSIVDNANLIKKVSFPREIIPISSITANLINFLLSLIVLFIFLIIFKVRFTFMILLLPLLVLTQFIFTLGISLISCTLYTSYRDVKYIVEVLLLSWFYLTPIFYPLSLIPQQYQRIYMLNPMACIVVMYRDVLLYGNMPNPKVMSYALLISFSFLIIGLIIFKKRETIFADLV